MNSKVLLPGTPTSKIKVREVPIRSTCLLIEVPVYNDIQKCIHVLNVDSVRVPL